MLFLAYRLDSFIRSPAWTAATAAATTAAHESRDGSDGMHGSIFRPLPAVCQHEAWAPLAVYPSYGDGAGVSNHEGEKIAIARANNSYTTRSTRSLCCSA